MTWFSPWLEAHTPTLLLWIGAFCTLGIYSILYRENRIYRFFEHIFLGVSTGYMVANTWTDVLLPKWWKPIWDQGHWWLIFATVVGCFYYFIYFPKFNWLARLVIGFFLGITSGLAFQGFVNGVWPQIPASFKPVIPHGEIKDAAGKALAPALNGSGAINNILFMLILLTVMSYFFFSFEQKNKLVRGSAQWGRWLLMFAFGAMFGSTVMARLALLIARIDFLLNDFGPVLGGPRTGPILMFVILIALAALILYLTTRQPAEPESGGE
jgi:hypothetical protein